MSKTKEIPPGHERVQKKIFGFLQGAILSLQ